MSAIEKPLQLQEVVEETGCFLLLAIEGGDAAAPALHGALVNLAKREPAQSVLSPAQCDLLLGLLADLEAVAADVLPPSIDRQELREGLEAAQRQVVFWALAPELRKVAQPDRVEATELRAQILRLSLFKIVLKFDLARLECGSFANPVALPLAAPAGVSLH